MNAKLTKVTLTGEDLPQDDFHPIFDDSPLWSDEDAITSGV